MITICALRCVLAMALVVLLPSLAHGNRAITARDCVTLRDIPYDESTYQSTIKISPDGNRFLYLVSAPNLAKNENDIELYVRGIPVDATGSVKPLLVGSISAVRWRPDAKNLTFLMKENGRVVLEQLDATTGDRHVLVEAEADIREYSMDRDGNTVVYATDEPSATKEGISKQEIATGYNIPFQSTEDASWPVRRLFVVRRTQTAWTTPVSISIRSPLSQQLLPALTHAANSDLQLVLSPDGEKLLVSYWDFSETMPDEWRRSSAMELRNNADVIQSFRILVLYTFATHETTVPLKTPFAYSAPFWFDDSKSFVVASAPEVSSDLERENQKLHLIGRSAGASLFHVEIGAGKVELVVRKLVAPWEGPLFHYGNGNLLVRSAGMDTFTEYSRRESQWREVMSFRVPLRVDMRVATNSKVVIGDFNDLTTPPQLFIYRPGDNKIEMLVKLNPQFDDLTIAQPREVHWKTSTGFDATGVLLLPPDYKTGIKYPLVIQTKPFTSQFVCGFGNFPSFAPQPIANTGIMYLGQIPTKDSAQRVEDYFPKGYPGYQGAGGLAEAAFAQDLWDSAVAALDEQGFVDRRKVGIIGFSRTGWYTEFLLAHSKIRYRAATVADNVQYSLGEYWLSRNANTLKSYDLLYGGPPYGATLKNWLENSVSFNLDQFHTPLLMEQMGYGMLYENRAAPPLGVAQAFEVFTGLNRLKKPVELYYYPNEIHTPDHPQARLATMQRNVDWYRFWLQDYERPNPEDAQQYTRWRKLHELQEEDAKNGSLGAMNPHSGPPTAPSGHCSDPK